MVFSPLLPLEAQADSVRSSKEEESAYAYNEITDNRQSSIQYISNSQSKKKSIRKNIYGAPFGLQCFFFRKKKKKILNSQRSKAAAVDYTRERSAYMDIIYDVTMCCI